MFRNLATLCLYIGIIFFDVKLPDELLLSYTFFMTIGDGMAYWPEYILQYVSPIANFFPDAGLYNIEYVPMVLLSVYIFINTIVKLIKKRV